MKLQTLRLSNFQSFGEEPTTLELSDNTYLIGPNGSGKTAALHALCRMFAFDPSLKRIKKSDFHVPFNEETSPSERKLWIEADFVFPELLEEEGSSTIPPQFNHMRLDDAEGIPRVRYRLTAVMGVDGDIEESLAYVLDIAEDGAPLTLAQVQRSDRNNIYVHYLPARRDPADHVAYGANALLGRLFRAINWDAERTTIKQLTDQISESLAENMSVNLVSTALKETWAKLHKGNFFSDPKVTFLATEIEALLRHLSVSFSPGHDETIVDFSRLSDGQKSMLYLSLVFTSQSIGNKVLAGDKSFDVDKLRPPIYTIIAVEEPENSLSPHYLGRIVGALSAITSANDAQAIIATHAPSMLRRVEPEKIAYLRLSETRSTVVSKIILPAVTDDAHKFVREAVQAFPEIYFSRLVILGEGASEEIVIPRLIKAKGAGVDELSVTVAPLGGRHVNHFWRLLTGLEIPYFTLLDLDVGRYQAGWGRFKYVNAQLAAHRPESVLPSNHVIPAWNDSTHKIRDFPNYLNEFELRSVYFSYPLDLDFAMLTSFPEAYDANPTKSLPNISTKKAVLGKNHHDPSQYNDTELKLFATYHKRFNLGSKPAAHINALSKLSDAELLAAIPASLDRLVDAVTAKLSELPE
jgi:putative ATP-dependent endonuclease of the OLD family